MTEPKPAYDVRGLINGLTNAELNQVIVTKDSSSIFAIYKATAEDTNLTWEAKGLLMYLLSLDYPARPNFKYIWKTFPGGRDRLWRMLGELETAGYLTRAKYRESDGLFNWEIKVRDLPPYPENQSMVNSSSEPLPENQGMAILSSSLTTKNKIGQEEDLVRVTSIKSTKSTKSNSVTSNKSKRERQEKEQEEKEVLDLEFSSLLDLWKELFPDKPQPHRPGHLSYTLTNINKFKTRMAHPGFQKEWRSALERAAKHPALHAKSWFNMSYFLYNDDNYTKLLEGQHDWMDDQLTDAELERLQPEPELDQMAFYAQFES